MESRVKLIRKELKMTQKQLAQRLGIGKAALSMIETGKCGLSTRNKNIIDIVSPVWLNYNCSFLSKIFSLLYSDN